MKASMNKWIVYRRGFGYHGYGGDRWYLLFRIHLGKFGKVLDLGRGGYPPLPNKIWEGGSPLSGTNLEHRLCVGLGIWDSLGQFRRISAGTHSHRFNRFVSRNRK